LYGNENVVCKETLPPPKKLKPNPN